MLLKRVILSSDNFPELFYFIKGLGVEIVNQSEAKQFIKCEIVSSENITTKQYLIDLQTAKRTSFLQYFPTEQLESKKVYELVATSHNGIKCASLFIDILSRIGAEEIAVKRVRPRFSFRVDSDGFNRNSLDKVVGYFSNFHWRFTWFVDVEPAGTETYFYKELADMGHEIQLHCFRHLYQPNPTKFYHDVSKGKAILEDTLQRSVYGYAGPSGRFSMKNYGILKNLKFKYVSDFSYVYDFDPFIMPENGLYQIPIYPFSIGRSLDAKINRRTYVEFLKKYLEFKYMQGQSVTLYAHPENRMENYLHELTEVFEFSDGLGFEHCNMNQQIKPQSIGEVKVIATRTLLIKLNSYIKNQKRFCLIRPTSITDKLTDLIYKLRTQNFLGRATLKKIL